MVASTVLPVSAPNVQRSVLGNYALSATFSVTASAASATVSFASVISFLTVSTTSSSSLTAFLKSLIPLPSPFASSGIFFWHTHVYPLILIIEKNFCLLYSNTLNITR